MFGGDADYAEFRTALLQTPAPDGFVAKALLLEILQQLFALGDYSRAPAIYRQGQDLAASLEQRRATGKVNEETAKRLKENFVETLPAIEARLKAGHAKYRGFCDLILREVFDEADRQQEEFAIEFLKRNRTDE